MGEKSRCSVQAQVLSGGREEGGGAKHSAFYLHGDSERFLCTERC